MKEKVLEKIEKKSAGYCGRYVRSYVDYGLDKKMTKFNSAY